MVLCKLVENISKISYYFENPWNSCEGTVVPKDGLFDINIIILSQNSMVLCRLVENSSKLLIT